MIVTTLEAIPHREVTASLGLVNGSTVRAKNIATDLRAGLRNLVGGELAVYTEMAREAREEALQRMVAQARSLGADAVLGVRFNTAALGPGTAEFLVYGTAVTLTLAVSA